MRGRWIRKEAAMRERIRAIPDESAALLAYRDPDDEDYEDDEEDKEEDDDGYREPSPDEEAARRAGRIAAACRVVTKR
jgi:hypothetical protein